MADADPVVAAIRQALALHAGGRTADAIRVLGGVRGLARHPQAQNVLGVLLMETGRTADALQAFDAAVALAPTFADAHCNRGVALQALGRREAALDAYDSALRNAPQHVNALFSRGNVLKLLGRPDGAVEAFGRVIQLQPNRGDAYLNRGHVQAERGDQEAALADFAMALRLQPGLVEAALGRVSALVALRRHDEALIAVDRVLADNPANGAAATIRGQILVDLDRPDEALAAVQRVATADRAVAASAGAVRSRALWSLGRRTEAIAAAEEAARLNPDDPALTEGLAYLHLTVGDFDRGWPLYEKRLARLDARQRLAEQSAPKWAGEDLAGKRVLVLTEQGNGDTLQFLRYVRLLLDRGAALRVVVQPTLLKLARSHADGVEWTDSVKAPGRFDYHVPLLSLPGLFGTRLATVPSDVPYLRADGARAAEWRAALGPDGFKVGIAWQGNPKYVNDHRRSAPLRFFAPLAAIPGVRLISLQAVKGLDQLARLPAGMAVESLGPQITANPDGIFEIAAVMESLDLVVTTDTAVAHLAGALGRPVWVALSDDPDWRWLLDRTDSPWYPAMRLFRQTARGDWAGVFGNIAATLGAMAGS